MCRGPHSSPVAVAYRYFLCLFLYQWVLWRCVESDIRTHSSLTSSTLLHLVSVLFSTRLSPFFLIHKVLWWRAIPLNLLSRSQPSVWQSQRVVWYGHQLYHQVNCVPLFECTLVKLMCNNCQSVSCTVPLCFTVCSWVCNCVLCFLVIMTSDLYELSVSLYDECGM